MYSTDLPQAQACRPAAWAMKVLPTPVWPISSTGRASLQPLQAVEFLDLRLADRAAGGEVDVLERRAQGELGGFDAIAGLSLLAVIGFGLQQRIEELACSWFDRGWHR